jgi:crossover junction endodeoxyribonuclease RuvC
MATGSVNEANGYENKTRTRARQLRNLQAGINWQGGSPPTPEYAAKTKAPHKGMAGSYRFTVDCGAMRKANGTKGCVRVLGVDPAAVGPTGYGLVESDGRCCKMLHYGAFRVDAKRQKESSGAALQDVHAFLCRLIEEFAPTVMAVESVFTALNVRTALRLAEVRGVVLLAAAQHGMAVHSYSPREVKASVAGYGQADKRQMQVMVRALLSMPELPEPADAADALAVALCHLQAEHARLRFALPDPIAPVRPRVIRAGVHNARGKETRIEAAGI